MKHIHKIKKLFNGLILNQWFDRGFPTDLIDLIYKYRNDYYYYSWNREKLHNINSLYYDEYNCITISEFSKFCSIKLKIYLFKTTHDVYRFRVAFEFDFPIKEFLIFVSIESPTLNKIHKKTHLIQKSMIFSDKIRFTEDEIPINSDIVEFYFYFDITHIIKYKNQTFVKYPNLSLYNNVHYDWNIKNIKKNDFNRTIFSSPIVCPKSNVGMFCFFFEMSQFHMNWIRVGILDFRLMPNIIDAKYFFEITIYNEYGQYTQKQGEIFSDYRERINSLVMEPPNIFNSLHIVIKVKLLSIYPKNYRKWIKLTNNFDYNDYSVINRNLKLKAVDYYLD